jgi:hypothetical protein
VVHPVLAFMVILGISGMASMVVCLLTSPEKDELLREFYTSIRPWGFWGPIYRQCRAQDPRFQKNQDFYRNWFNILVGLVWQIAFVAMTMYVVIQQYDRLLLCLAVFAVTSVILKFTWYDKLGPGEMYLVEPKSVAASRK